MNMYKDCEENELIEGDSVETIQDIKIKEKILPKGSILNGLKFSEVTPMVEFNSVQLEGNHEDIVLHTKLIKKI